MTPVDKETVLAIADILQNNPEITYESISKKIGVSPSTISRVYRKKFPRYSNELRKYDFPARVFRSGEMHPMSCYTTRQIHHVCKLLDMIYSGEESLTYREISDRTGVKPSSVMRIAFGEEWVNIAKQYHFYGSNHRRERLMSMPWIKGRYKVSIYSKNELPTWNEVYNEFYKKAYWRPCSEYTPEMIESMDPYWNIKRSVYLYATICNQFNKMIHEDNVFPKYADMLMVCHQWYPGDPFPIYTIPNPNGNKDPFIMDKDGIERIDVTKTELGQLRFILASHHIYQGETKFKEILDDLILPFKDYFEGERAGWKDEDGNIITSKDETKACRTGFDPAL